MSIILIQTKTECGETVCIAAVCGIAPCRILKSLQDNIKEKTTMSDNSNSINVPEARQAMEKFKMECANEVGVNLKDGYNGDLTSRQAGSVGGQMVKKMIEAYERSM